MKRGRIYKAVRPNLIIFGIKIFLSLCCFLVVAAMIFASVCEYIRNKDYGTLVPVGLISLVFYVIIAVMVIRSLKNEKRYLDSRAQTLQSIDGYKLERLEEEAQTAEKYFGCFYVLDEYLFVPKAGLLIRYDEIRTFKTIYHSTNGVPDGVYIEVFDRENIKYRFSVNKWRDYKNSYNEFMDLLHGKGLGERKAPENNGYIPVGSG
ncbi:MAG: hypothetical protein K2N72_09280 [Oscillospiraceae bacterium]|nr:hypothetical protein [Oscillospiraceae bacterium]